MRVIKFKVVDDTGTGVAGQTISVGKDNLTTNAMGLTQMLFDDDSVAIKVNGAKVYEGPSAGLKDLQTYNTKGEAIA